MFRRGDQKPPTSPNYFGDASKDFADASKIFRRRIQGFRRRVQRFHRRRDNAVDTTSYPCGYPLDSAAHPNGIVNVVSGQIGSTEVNVHNVVTIGTEQMKVFESRLPQGLFETITKRLLLWIMHGSMWRSELWKYLMPIWCTQWLLALQASGRDVDIKDVVGHELAPLPTSMFTDTGYMREDCEIEICLEENSPSCGVWQSCWWCKC